MFIRLNKHSNSAKFVWALTQTHTHTHTLTEQTKGQKHLKKPEAYQPLASNTFNKYCTPYKYGPR